VVKNATLLTMETGSEQADRIQGGILLVRDGMIEAVLHPEQEAQLIIPSGAYVIDARGGAFSLVHESFSRLDLLSRHLGFVTPGFIDVHAHWNGFASPFPARSWELETFLAYGVTTLHKFVENAIFAPCS
jgi:imidazolonepropionase-like amidohydrolase